MKTLLPTLIVLCLVLGMPAAAHAQTASVQGVVVDDVTGQPLPGVNVYVETPGVLRQGAATDLDGRYRIDGLAPGVYTLVGSFIGFKEYRTNVTLQAGQTATHNIELSEDRVGLEEIVVTGQGSGIESRRLSTTVEVITPRQIEDTPAARLDEILQAQLPGAQVRFSSGQPGTASLIRSRGPISANSSTTPVIYVDGVRVDNLNTSQALELNTGGAMSSSLSDIPVENIERIEFIKGGAATTLYGSDAANGVIQIFTKKGLPGRSTFTFQSMLGWMSGTDEFFRFRNTADVLFEPGLVQEYSLSGSGGTQDFTYSFSGSMYEDNGFRLNNEQVKYGLRSAVSARVTPITQYTGTFAFASNIYERDVNANFGPQSQLGQLEGGDLGNIDELEGDAFTTMQDSIRHLVNLVDITGDTKRFQTAQRLAFNPLPSLTASVTLGLDYRANTEQFNDTPELEIATGNDPTGSQIIRAKRDFLGLTFEGTAQHQATLGSFSFVTVAGGQVFRDDDKQTRVIGENIAQGTGSIDNSAEQTADDFELVVANYGLYLQENIGFKDRYFLEGGLRLDANSAFGEEIGTVAYPKLGVSYVLSSEPFFANNVSRTVISNLKLRANLGYAGKFPAPFTNEREVLAAPYLGKIAYTFGQSGNDNLEPERVRTFEAGGDLALFNDRLLFEVTYFDALTENALFRVPFVPSSGLASQLFNVGEIQNRGWELSSSLYLISNRELDVRLNASLNTLTNEVTDNGGTPEFNIDGFTFLGQWVKEGEPIGYLRGDRPNVDPTTGRVPVDDDGNLDVERNADLGSPLPDGFGTLGLSATFRNRLRLLVTADYQWGAQGVATDDVLRFINSGINLLTGGDEIFIDEDRFPQGGRPAVEQAWLEGETSFFDLAGAWVEDTDFLKVRLISLSYTLPERWYQNRLIRQIEVGFRAVNPFNVVSSSFDPEVTGSNGVSGTGGRQDATNVGVFAFGTESPPRQFLFDLKVRF